MGREGLATGVAEPFDRGRGMMGRSGEGDGGWKKGRQRQLHPWDGRSRWVEA